MPTDAERRKRFRNLVVECPIALYEKVDKAAHESRQTKSQLVRSAVIEYISNVKEG